MALHQPLEHIVSPRVLVVGGGIAGMQAALEAAAVGLPVTLVEAGPSLGGVMARLDKTFPTNDCAMCILSPRMLALAHHPGIEVQTCTHLLALRGEAGNFQAVLSRRPRYVDEAVCTGCGECVRVCPKKLPDPHNYGLNPTKAIHIPFPQAIPNAAVVSPEACRYLQGKPCEACLKVCPTGAIDFQQQTKEWVLPVGAVILATGAQPMAGDLFPGYGHPNVVTSAEFERLLSATGPHQGTLRRPSDQTLPARIAFIQCVGSRQGDPQAQYCSSFCCLASLKEALVAQEISDYRVQATIFYMDLRAQGKGFERYLEQAREQGLRLIRSRVREVEPRAGGEVGIHYTDGTGLALQEDFDLVVLAVGLRPAPALAEHAHRLGLPLNQAGFLPGTPLQGAATSRAGIFVCGTAQEARDIPETVISAGAAAAEASRLLTLAARPAGKSEMLPEIASDADQPLRIGVFLCHCGTNIAHSIDLERLAACAQGLPGVVHVETNLFTCSVDATQRMSACIRDHDLNRVVVAACSPRTHEVVFRQVLQRSGLNPGYLALANIREQCAWVHQGEPDHALDKARHLLAMAVRRAGELTPIQTQGTPIIPQALVLGGGIAGLTAALSLADQGFQTYVVERSPHLGGLARRLWYTLEGIDPQKFLLDLEASVLAQPNIEVLTRAEVTAIHGAVGRFSSQVHQQTLRGRVDRHLDHGVIIIATGGRELEPTGRYLYGRDPRVMTQLELEGKIGAAAPELDQLRRLVMIQCVGSREPEHPYCSRLCCAEALKNALRLRKRYPRLDITILYRDIRAYGWREGHYQEAREHGVRFFPYDPERPPNVAAPAPRRPLTVSYWDDQLGREIILSADRVILSAGVEAAAGTPQVARILGVPLTQDGFVLEAHQKLRPVDTVVEGVFLCGVAHYPKSMGESVSQALAAASRAAEILFQEQVASGEIFAATAPARCRRCLHCAEVCPFGAVQVPKAGPPLIQVELCRGCGICAAECPAQAIDMSRVTQAELAVQIAAALDR